MKATVLVAPHRFDLLDRPVPTPGDEDVLIRVRACGICGTDLKIIHTGMPHMPPYGEFIFGHEYAGDIVAVGLDGRRIPGGRPRGRRGAHGLPALRELYPRACTRRA